MAHKHILAIAILCFINTAIADTYQVPQQFTTIQQAIEASQDGDTIQVAAGIYTGEVIFKGKAITIQGIPDETGAPILTNPGNFAVTCMNKETPGSILTNFIIKDSYIGVYIAGSNPTLKNLTIVNNKYGAAAYYNSNPDIQNCIFWQNTKTDLSGCKAQYSFISDSTLTYLDEGLIGYWGFDDIENNQVIDSTGNNHGTIRGARPLPGFKGQGMAFDGNNDVVEIGPGVLPAGPKSLFAWVKLPPVPSGVGTDCDYFIYAGKTKDGAMTFYYNDGVELRWYHHFIPSTPGIFDVKHSVELDDNQWHHVGITYDGSTCHMYLDGVVVDTVHVEEQYQITQQEGIGGQYGNTTNRSWLGLLDEVIMYNRALSANEVTFLMQGTDPRFAAPELNDYHLQSERGRHWPEYNIWVLDTVTSPCIDAGDPNADFSNEPCPNGSRINMGAYGGTAYASLQSKNLSPRISFYYEPVVQSGTLKCEVYAWDIDGYVAKVDLYIDGNLAATDSTPEDGWQFAITVQSGSHSVQVCATDNENAVKATESISVFSYIPTGGGR